MLQRFVWLKFAGFCNLVAGLSYLAFGSYLAKVSSEIKGVKAGWIAIQIALCCVCLSTVVMYAKVVKEPPNEGQVRPSVLMTTTCLDEERPEPKMLQRGCTESLYFVIENNLDDWDGLSFKSLYQTLNLSQFGEILAPE